MKTRDKSFLQVNLSMFGSWMLRSSLEAECCEIVKMIEWHWIYNYINCFITTCPIYIKYSMRCTWIVDEYRRASLSIQIIRITHSLRAHCWPGVSATTQQSGYKRCETKNQTHFGFVQATYKIIQNHSRLVQRSGNLWSKQHDWTWHWEFVTSSALQSQQHCPLDWAQPPFSLASLAHMPSPSSIGPAQTPQRYRVRVPAEVHCQNKKI